MYFWRSMIKTAFAPGRSSSPIATILEKHDFCYIIPCIQIIHLLHERMYPMDRQGLRCPHSCCAYFSLVLRDFSFKLSGSFVTAVLISSSPQYLPPAFDFVWARPSSLPQHPSFRWKSRNLPVMLSAGRRNCSGTYTRVQLACSLTRPLWSLLAYMMYLWRSSKHMCYISV